MTETPNPITVQFVLGPDTVIGTRSEYDDDGYAHQQPETLADRVATLVAHNVYQAHRNGGDAYWDQGKVDAAIDRIIEERAREILNRVLTPTDGFGQPKGEPTTFAELIDKRLGEWFNEATKNRDGYRNGPNNLRALIDEAVGRQLTNDLNEVLKNARAQLLTEFKARSIEAWTEIMAKSVVK